VKISLPKHLEIGDAFWIKASLLIIHQPLMEQLCHVLFFFATMPDVWPPVWRPAIRHRVWPLD
jgi:hypothetical protein